MAESVTFSGSIAMDFFIPICTGMGYRKQAHTHDGYEPYMTVYLENHEGVSYLAIRRLEDKKIFVTEVPSWDDNPYSDDPNHFVDEFGGVMRVIGPGEIEEVVPTPDVTFREATLIDIPRENGSYRPWDESFAYVQ